MIGSTFGAKKVPFCHLKHVAIQPSTDLVQMKSEDFWKRDL